MEFAALGRTYDPAEMDPLPDGLAPDRVEVPAALEGFAGVARCTVNNRLC